VKRINLLPPEARVKASRERGLLYVIVLLGVVVVALFLGYMWQNSVATSKQSELDQVTSQANTVEQQAAQLRPYAQIQTERTLMTQTARALYDARVPWSTILEEISLVIPESVRLQSLTCAVPGTMLPGAAAASTQTAGATTADVTFTGSTLNHDDVAEFMTRLGLIPQLTNVQLVSSAAQTATSSSGTSGSTSTGSSGTAASTTETVTFTVTASLRPYLTAPPKTVASKGVTP